MFRSAPEIQTLAPRTVEGQALRALLPRTQDGTPRDFTSINPNSPAEQTIIAAIQKIEGLATRAKIDTDPVARWRSLLPRNKAGGPADYSVCINPDSEQEQWILDAVAEIQILRAALADGPNGVFTIQNGAIIEITRQEGCASKGPSCAKASSFSELKTATVSTAPANTAQGA